MTMSDDLRRMGFSDEQIASARVDGRPLSEVDRAKASRLPRGMNKTETLYAVELDYLQREGAIKRWAFEAVKFRLADRTWYTPDFPIWLHDGRMRLVEVKGPFIREAGRIRFRVARELYPEHEWLMVQRGKGGQWREVQ